MTEIVHETSMWPECLRDLTARQVYADWLQERYEGHELIAFLRSDLAVSKSEFRTLTIARDADDGETHSDGSRGWVAWEKLGVAFLANFSHGTWYDTFEDVFSSTGRDLNDVPRPPDFVNWIGSVEELIAMAKRQADPSRPDRTIVPEDSDFGQLREVYRQVLCKYGRTEIHSTYHLATHKYLRTKIVVWTDSFVTPFDISNEPMEESHFGPLGVMDQHQRLLKVLNGDHGYDPKVDVEQYEKQFQVVYGQFLRDWNNAAKKSGQE